MQIWIHKCWATWTLTRGLWYLWLHYREFQPFKAGMGITWKDLKLWNCEAKKQNKPLSVEAPWARSWIASLVDKLYLSLKKTHPAFLVISTWFGEWLSSLAVALRSATDVLSGRTRDNGNWVLEKLLFSTNLGVTRIRLSEKNPTNPHTGRCEVKLSVLECKLSTAKARWGTFGPAHQLPLPPWMFVGVKLHPVYLSL